MIYVRYPLSLRNVEDLLQERGISNVISESFHVKTGVLHKTSSRRVIEDQGKIA